MNANKVFHHCVKYKLDDGYHSFDCVHGYWGVMAADYNSALREARHYFIQYFGDGDYDKHIETL